VAETPEIRLKRLAMRSWRRGTKEMDMILGPFADRALAGLSPADLDAFEALLEENDQDLYRWVAGADAPPARHAAMIARLRAGTGGDV
jgi:antitoxin CptB